MLRLVIDNRPLTSQYRRMPPEHAEAYDLFLSLHPTRQAWLLTLVRALARALPSPRSESVPPAPHVEHPEPRRASAPFP